MFQNACTDSYFSRRSPQNDGYLLSLFYLHHWWCSEIDSHSPCISRQFCWQNSCPVWSGSRWELACDLLDWWERNQNTVIGQFPPLPPLLQKNKQQHKLISPVGLSWHEQSTCNWQKNCSNSVYMDRDCGTTQYLRGSVFTSFLYCSRFISVYDLNIQFWIRYPPLDSIFSVFVCFVCYICKRLHLIGHTTQRSAPHCH